MQNKIIYTIKGYVFPIFCLGCNKEGKWVCSDCFVTIGRAGIHACPVCHKYNGTGANCFQCEPNSSLDFHRAVVKYSEKDLIGKVIHAFKFQYAENIILLFEKIISNYLSEHRGAYSNIDLIVAVPLHPRRYAERGFNQAELIAEIVNRILGVETQDFASLLRRNRYTKIQSRLKKFDRIKNVSGAFALRQAQDKIKDKNILLVDDVFTTGSTMQECARVLRHVGANSVCGFTLARG